MEVKRFRQIWDKYFEYDRIAERKIMKSIRLWHGNNIISKTRAMLLYNKIRKTYSCSINPRITIGQNLYISHAQDIVIGQTSEIGDNCRIYPGAKLVARVEGDLELAMIGKRRHPKIGDNCLLGADCIIIGPVDVGDNVTIAAGAIVTKNVPNNTTVIGTNTFLSKNHRGGGKS
ncbi:MAG: hypothetical protein LUD07_02610 [Clostridiales bacterium]|nr:hypothetical protein [Clostridiales bacterium]